MRTLHAAHAAECDATTTEHGQHTTHRKYFFSWTSNYRYSGQLSAHEIALYSSTNSSTHSVNDIDWHTEGGHVEDGDQHSQQGTGVIEEKLTRTPPVRCSER